MPLLAVGSATHLACASRSFARAFLPQGDPALPLSLLSAQRKHMQSVSCSHQATLASAIHLQLQTWSNLELRNIRAPAALSSAGLELLGLMDGAVLLLKVRLFKVLGMHRVRL